MNFIHDDNEFDDLLRIVADRNALGISLVEKDYWVTHALWSLHQEGLDIWFKGGTSLSKGFDLIERFSEDLDLKIEPGSVTSLHKVSNWKSDGKKATAERLSYFEKLVQFIRIPGTSVVLEPQTDRLWRSANLRVNYPRRHADNLNDILKPFVLLEVGSALVTPFIERKMTSYVHEFLITEGQLTTYTDNRPRGVRCVHPFVTLLEKLEALHRRVPSDNEPAGFVRHFEDAARIIAHNDPISVLDPSVRLPHLANDMLTTGSLRALPFATDGAFIPDASPRWNDIRAAHAAIEPMFWGNRIPLEEACAAIQKWVRATFPT